MDAAVLTVSLMAVALEASPRVMVSSSPTLPSNFTSWRSTENSVPVLPVAAPVCRMVFVCRVEPTSGMPIDVTLPGAAAEPVPRILPLASMEPSSRFRPLKFVDLEILSISSFSV